jgi:hypothetical protein
MRARKEKTNEMKMIKLRLLIWLAKRLFNYIVVWEAEERATLFLAHSQRDINIATRGYVEALDEYYKQQERERQNESSE